MSYSFNNMVRGAFSDAELGVLRGAPSFTLALQSLRTLEDFESLCKLGDELLNQELESTMMVIPLARRGAANSSAQRPALN